MNEPRSERIAHKAKRDRCCGWYWAIPSFSTSFQRWGSHFAGDYFVKQSVSGRWNLLPSCSKVHFCSLQTTVKRTLPNSNLLGTWSPWQLAVSHLSKWRIINSNQHFLVPWGWSAPRYSYIARIPIDMPWYVDGGFHTHQRVQKSWMVFVFGNIQQWHETWMIWGGYSSSNMDDMDDIIMIYLHSIPI